LQWPELPAHLEKSISIYTNLWEYASGRTDKLGRGLPVLVGLLRPLVPVF
jgi:hypothetical protein